MIGLYPRGLNPLRDETGRGKKLTRSYPQDDKVLRVHTLLAWFFLHDFRFHYVIYPHLYVICNPACYLTLLQYIHTWPTHRSTDPIMPGIRIPVVKCMIWLGQDLNPVQGQNSSVCSVLRSLSYLMQHCRFDPSLIRFFSGWGDFSLGVNMGSDSIPPLKKTLSDESIDWGLVCAHIHSIAWTQKILTLMSYTGGCLQ